MPFAIVILVFAILLPGHVHRAGDGGSIQPIVAIQHEVRRGGSSAGRLTTFRRGRRGSLRRGGGE
eukprot:13772369-Alexandrium_andersonii.AAC.1